MEAVATQLALASGGSPVGESIALKALDAIPPGWGKSAEGKWVQSAHHVLTILGNGDWYVECPPGCLDGAKGMACAVKGVLREYMAGHPTGLEPGCYVLAIGEDGLTSVRCR